jgi:hypothetical protein
MVFLLNPVDLLIKRERVKDKGMLCLIAISTHDFMDNVVIVGQVFARKYPVFMNYDEDSIGVTVIGGEFLITYVDYVFFGVILGITFCAMIVLLLLKRRRRVKRERIEAMLRELHFYQKNLKGSAGFAQKKLKTQITEGKVPLLQRPFFILFRASLQYVVPIMCFVLVGFSFFQRPRWCVEKFGHVRDK